MNFDQFAADLLLRVTILLLVLLVLDWILARQNKPLIRSAVWHAGLFGLLVVPMLGFVISPIFQWQESTRSMLSSTPSLSKFAQSKLSSTQDAAELDVANQLDVTKTHSSPTNQVKQDVLSETITVAASSNSPHWNRFFQFFKTSIYCGIFFGYFFSAFRLIHSLLRTARIYRNSTPIGESSAKRQFEIIRTKLGIGTTVSLAVSDEIDVPMVIGAFRPRVLIPSPMKLDDDLECILTHELIHVRRADPVWNLALKFTSTLYWFHPLIHVSRRRITDVREQICDNYCIHVIGRLAYGSALIDVAKRLASSTRTNPPLELAALRKTSLEQRIAFIRNSEGDSRFLATSRSRFTWLTISILAALLTSSFTVFQIKAAPLSGAIQIGSDSFETDMWNFTDEQKKIFAELLRKGDDEVESVTEKVAILTMIRDKNKENFEQIKSWSGAYKKVFDVLRGDRIDRGVLQGHFVIAPPLDSIISEDNMGESFIVGIDGSKQLQKNTKPVTDQWISTPEHVLLRTSLSRNTIHRMSRLLKGDNVPMLDPRDWLGPEGWTTSDFLSVCLEHASREDFWDRASLTKTKSDAGLVYTYKSIYDGDNLIKTKNVAVGTFSISFSENAGYLPSSRSTNLAGYQETIRFDHEKQSGIYLPFRRVEKHQMQVASGDVVKREETIELTLTGLNKELPKDTFDIAHLEPSDDDILIDDLNGKAMRYWNGRFQEFDRKSIGPNRYFIKQRPDESEDWKIIQLVKTYKFQLVANENGGLKEIIGSGGFWISDGGKPASPFKTATSLVDKLKQAAQMTGTGIAQHFHFTLIPDPSLEQDEIEKVQKELSFEMMFADGTMKTVPTISLGQSE